MNDDWWLYGGTYVALVVFLTVRFRLSAAQTVLVALLPVVWPVALPVYLARRAGKRRDGQQAPTSSDL